MTLADSYRCARSLEAIENYSRADDPLLKEFEVFTDSTGESEVLGGPYPDETFWYGVFENPELAWEKEFRLEAFALSEWISRVPGLFWSEGSAGLRDLARSAVEHKSQDWVTYQPYGKSALVLGGVGTLKFPTDNDGRRLATLSRGHNASSGIPALIYPEVWEHHKLQEGDILTGNARWHKMDIGWAERFPSILGIPRGYLIFKNPQQLLEIDDYDRGHPTQFHPFTVMEYSKGDTMLYDFVFATADTRVEKYRKRLENFFSQYKNKKERYGRYLLSADISNPLFDAEYDNPASLRRAEAGARAQLELLQARIRTQNFNNRTIESILQILASNYDNDSLAGRITTYIGIPKAQWYTSGSIADSAAQLLQICIEREKVEELLDALARDRPDLFH